MSNPISTALVTAHLSGEYITEQRHAGMHDYFASRIEGAGKKVPSTMRNAIGKFTVGYADLGVNTLEVEVAVPNEAVAALMPTDGPDDTQEMGLLDIVVHRGAFERGTEPDELAYLSFMYLSSGRIALRTVDIPSVKDEGLSEFLQGLQLGDVSNATAPANFPMMLDEVQAQALGQHISRAA